MTTMNKKIGNCKSRILRNLDLLLKIQRYRNLKFGKESLVYFFVLAILKTKLLSHKLSKRIFILNLNFQPSFLYL